MFVACAVPVATVEPEMAISCCLRLTVGCCNGRKLATLTRQALYSPCAQTSSHAASDRFDAAVVCVRLSLASEVAWN